MTKIYETEFPALPLWQGIQDAPGIRHAYPFRLVWDARGYCRQNTPPEVLAQVVAAYAENYTHITAPPGASAWADRLGEMQIAFVMDNAVPGNAILEIGAGSLYVARRLKSALAACEYVIIDPALKEGGGIAEIVPDYFPAAALKDRRFGSILAFNSLEHADDAEGFLRGIRKHLAPGGRGLLCFPDVSSQFANTDLNVLVHEHISYFVPASFAAMARRCGLAPRSMRTGENMLWAVVESGETEMSAISPEECFPEAGSFSATVEAKAREITGELAAGKKVVFHGATNGLNNFLYLSGLAGRPDIVVYDGDASKAGRFLPACPQAIRAGDDPQYRKADIVYVSAMTFFDPIAGFLARHHGFSRERIRGLFP